MTISIVDIPQKTQILVIGGGPSGSYAATLLAREGFQVALLERDVFPRYHIGESMLPSLSQFLKLIDAEKIVSEHGFVPKPGAAVKLNQHSREGYTDFNALDSTTKAWNVIRSEFDDILFKHAASNGVSVHDGVKVTSIEFDPSDYDASVPASTCAPGRPVAAEYTTKSGHSGRINFDWLVDASGRAGVMSTRYMKGNRRINQSLKNVAVWGYWVGGGAYAPGTNKENAPWFESLTDQSGWSWYIPLHNKTVSVGFVMSEDSSLSKKKAMNTTYPTSNSVLKDHYIDQIRHAPGLQKLLGNARLLELEEEGGGVKSASDYSYSATAYGGDHFRIVGDAGAFIDPFFSSGVHLAFTSALSAACTIAASIRMHTPESLSIRFHDQKFGTAYTRFLFVVLSAYKQVRAQQDAVLQDVDEGNFDRAFDAIRPVIQGVGAIPVAGDSLTEAEVQKTIDFCAKIFGGGMHAPNGVAEADTGDASNGPTVLATDESQIKASGSCKDDEEVAMMMKDMSARKKLHAGMYDVAGQFGIEDVGGAKGSGSGEGEVFVGLTTCCERGKLGLMKVVADN